MSNSQQLSQGTSYCKMETLGEVATCCNQLGVRGKRGEKAVYKQTGQSSGEEMLTVSSPPAS